MIGTEQQNLNAIVPGPDMSSAIIGWCQPMTLGIQTIRAGAGGDAEIVTRTVDTSGVLIATKPQKLLIKEGGEGTRKWKWWKLYTLTDPQAEVGDVLEIFGRRFKILEASDYSQFGFWDFVCVEDFQP